LLDAKKNMDPRWAGATVVCIASGPSLCAEDLEFVRTHHAAGLCKVIVVNREFEFAPWADVLYAADHRCWQEYIADIRKVFAGELWTMDGQAAKIFKLNLIKRGSTFGYSEDPGTINTGGNSGYQAVHLAAYWGAKRIVLLGYDMQRTGGLEHHYGKHRGRLPNGKAFEEWIRRFKPLIIALKQRGVLLLNATRSTAIPETWIARISLESIPWR
jgi:hypothetical protein